MQVRIGFSPNADELFSKPENGESKKPRQWDGMWLDTDPTYVHKWYDSIKEFTFPTEIIKLTLDEANAIKFMCQHYHIYKNSTVTPESEKISEGVIANYDLYKLYNDNSYNYGEQFNWKRVVAEKYLNPMLSLEKKIDAIMNRMNWKDGIFIGLHTHSPKDAAMHSINTYKLFYEELKLWDKINRFNEDMTEEEADCKSKNNLYLKDIQICQAYYRSASKSLGYKNGFAALDTFCRSYEKIFYDINLSMLKQDEENVKLYLILRKWEKELDPIWEFRLVVQNNQPTGLCQYHATSMIPMIGKYHKYVENGILNQFNKIQPNLSKELVNYTMDFAVILKNKSKQNRPYDEKYYNYTCEEKENDCNPNPIDSIIMIEINHEPPIAGTPLFDVKNNENDKRILKEGPFEFRYYKSNNDVEDKHFQKSFPHIVDYVNVLKGELIPSQENKVKLVNVIDDNNNTAFRFCKIL